MITWGDFSTKVPGDFLHDVTGNVHFGNDRHGCELKTVVAYLETIAYAENRYAQLEDFGVDAWGVLVVHRVWRAGQDYP